MRRRPTDRFTCCPREAENGRGEFFGDVRLEEVVRANQRRTSAELLEELLSEIGHWRPAAVPQQDDITLVVIDVVDLSPESATPVH